MTRSIPHIRRAGARRGGARAPGRRAVARAGRASWSSSTQSAGRDAAAVDAATRAVQTARGADAELRITRTPTEQLSVTRYFAARGYDVVGVGLDPEIAVDPVAERYPDTRFTLVGAGGLPAAVASAAAR